VSPTRRWGCALLCGALTGCEQLTLGPGVSGPCPDGPLFSVPALPLAEINHISPLGNLNPPEHTLPTPHTYWNVHQPGAKPVVVSAPGELVIVGIDRTQFSGSPHEDYTIDFAVCHAVLGRFAHLSALSASLASELTGGECRSMSSQHGTTTSCRFELKHRVAPGEFLGYVGDLSFSGGLDFGLEDHRVPWNSSSPRWQGLRVWHVCPVDYYEPGVRTQLESRFGDGLVVRTTEPRCGRFDYNVPGTAQGDWILVGGTGFREHFALALAADNVYPSSLAFSIGMIGSSWDGFVLMFTARGAGRVNRPFDEVTADGAAYCFEELTPNRDGTGPGIANLTVLLQLQDDGRLRFETQSGSACGAGPWSFTAAARMLEQ